MKNHGRIIAFFIALTLILQACGPSEAEKRAAEQARMDSIRAVQEREIAEQMAALQDSLDKAEAADLEEDKKEERADGQIHFSENGEYAVQIGAFRSEDKANNYLSTLSQRNYPSSYVVKIGTEDDGDIWFRLRVGYFDHPDEAAKLGEILAREINSEYWVSKVTRSGH